jgi:hypothetical protein
MSGRSMGHFFATSVTTLMVWLQRRRPKGEDKKKFTFTVCGHHKGRPEKKDTGCHITHTLPALRVRVPPPEQGLEALPEIEMILPHSGNPSSILLSKRHIPLERQCRRLFKQ